MAKTVENPCFHCYAGAIGECSMTPCKHQLKPWSKDVETMEIEVDDDEDLESIDAN